MAIQLHLVRHGEAEAGWDLDPDPGLSRQGQLQSEVLRDRLLGWSPLPLLSSPLRRAQETAAPLAAAWDAPIIIDPVLREIPAPPHLDLQARMAWLLSIRNWDWSQVDDALWQWRIALLDRLFSLESSAVLFTHFMVLNLVAGVACGCSRLVHYQPANGSLLTVSVEPGRLSVLDWGQQAPSRVL